MDSIDPNSRSKRVNTKPLNLCNTRKEKALEVLLHNIEIEMLRGLGFDELSRLYVFFPSTGLDSIRTSPLYLLLDTFLAI